MVAVPAGGQMASFAADNDLKAEAVTDANGNLHLPDAYRTRYQFLGTWAVAADQGARRRRRGTPDSRSSEREIHRRPAPI